MDHFPKNKPDKFLMSDPPGYVPKFESRSKNTYISSSNLLIISDFMIRNYTLIITVNAIGYVAINF